MYRAVAVLALAGCGRSGFGLEPPRSDGKPADATGDTATTDTPADVLPPADALPPCTRLAISDNFDDGVRAAFWTLLANNPVNVAETGGELQIALATAGGAHYGGYDSTATYDLRDHCMFVTYAGVPANEPMVEMTFSARDAASNSTGFVYHQGQMDPYVNNGTFTSLGAVPFDPTVNKVVLVRDDAGTITYETSTDGVSYTVLAQHAEAFDMSAITVTVEAGTFGSAPAPGTALYDDFNAP